MIIWINGAFGAGKTTTAFELQRRLPGSFVYDPENVGYYIRKNAPAEFSRGDFQDIPLWREMNYKMLKMILSQFGGAIICPMTLVNSEYFSEIIGRLRQDGVDVRHFILYASRETLLKRLRLRNAGWFNRDSFAISSIDRCIHAFDNTIKEGRIETDIKPVGEVVEEIAHKCGLELSPDRRGPLKKRLDRALTLVRHIRGI